MSSFRNGPSKLLMPVTLADAEKKVKKAEKALDKAEESRDKLLKDAEVQCLNKSCGAYLRIGDLTYIQTHWYVQPHGCTGGDYYRAGEGQFKCPKCGMRNRMLGENVEKLKVHFKEVEDTYDDD